MSKIARFCISDSVRSGAARPCSPDEFERLIDNVKLRETLDQLKLLAAGGDKEAYRRLKETLPVNLFHAMRYEGGKRSVDKAVRSGLVMFDVDHVADPAALWQAFIDKGGMVAFAVALAHRTPSDEGLRIVVERPDGISIADVQRQLADLLGVAYDTSTCDDARASFVVSRDRILYMDASHLWYPDEDTPDNRSRIEADNQRRFPSSKERRACLPPSTSQSLPPSNPGGGGAPGSVKENGSPCASEHNSQLSTVHSPLSTVKPPSFSGIAYTDIVRAYFEKKLGRQPLEGERNVQLLAAARDLWAITEGSEEKLRQIMPSMGLSDDEMDTIVHNAAAYRKANPIAKIPYLLWSVIKELEEKNDISTGIGDDFDEGMDEAVSDEVVEAEASIPTLPPVIKELVGIAPSGFKIPSVIACLAPLGTVLTRLRAPYIDGQMTFPGFHVVIEAPQASGKSFASRVVDTILRYVKEHDKVERAVEKEYERLARLNKNAKKQEEDPRVIIQCVPATISIAKILKRFDQSQGLGLFSFCCELDTLTKSNKRGAWSQKSDLYRIAFDGEEYGQDYMSENSYSTTVEARYNILSTGTPRALERMYADGEDGLVSRCIFGALGNQRYRSMPVWGRMTRQQQRTVDAKLHEAFALSFDETGRVMPEHEMSLPFLCGEMNIWLERKRLEAAKAGSIAIDTFRRRAALNGFRAGMMAHWLWGESPRRRKDVTAFALFIADLTLDGQLRRFANQLEVGEGQESPSLVLTRNNNRTIALYDSLPDVFTTADVAQAASEFLIKTPARNVIYGWKSAGLIEKTDVSQFRKLGG